MHIVFCTLNRHPLIISEYKVDGEFEKQDTGK